jgi:hypothetical protein
LIETDHDGAGCWKSAILDGCAHRLCRRPWTCPPGGGLSFALSHRLASFFSEATR